MIAGILQNRSRLPHALLITGAPDAVFEELNPILQALLCETGHDKACGLCHSCTLFHSEAGHPDFHIIRPEGKLNITKIDAVRDVTLFLEQSSMRGGMRIAVFTEADTLNIASQNALLKSLEEPGFKTLIVLISAKPHLLLPTIKSRCQLLACERESNENLKIAESLLAPFDPLQFVEANKDLDLLACTHTQMALIHDLLSLQYGELQLSFAPLHAKLKGMSTRISSKSLLQFYKTLLEKSEIFQKKVAVNQELCLFELLSLWKQLVKEQK